ncbi:STE like transcription factor family protein [Candida albicans]|uniref:STE like transcription factor family protein n=1 Tax=Candida albicans TaxID=5476 RepID=A0A8H6BTH0_CANAX|nr:STE like transcription factor family protein [Candida albicans]
MSITKTYNGDPTSLVPTQSVKESLRLIEDLKFFLATAPANWQENQVIRRYYLNHDEGFVSCVYWNNLYFITGTDIVRCIFSDLRNLKCGADAILEPPRSEFLEFLFKNSCLRTQKKQKVFFWFNVPHDKLMADALERDLKKEKMGQRPTTMAHREPALSFHYDDSTSNTATTLTDTGVSSGLNNTTSGGGSDSATSTHNNNEASTKPSNGSEKSSPEYTTTARGRDEFGFLNEATPSQYKANSDYEDDFPLDYINQTTQNSEDYITLDANYQAGSYANMIEDNYDSFLDATLFIPPSLGSANGGEEFFPAYQNDPSTANAGFVPPISAKYATQFATRQVATPTYIKAIPQTGAAAATGNGGQPQQYYDQATGNAFYPAEIPVSYNVVHPESEYWTNNSGAVATTAAAAAPMYDASGFPIPINQSYMVMNEHEMVPYQYMNSNGAMIGMIPPHQQQQQQQQQIAMGYQSMLRQQQQQQQQQQQPSSTMTKKKKQIHSFNNNKSLSSNGGGITKKSHDNNNHSKVKTSYGSLNDVVNSKVTKVINKEEVKQSQHR